MKRRTLPTPAASLDQIADDLYRRLLWRVIIAIVGVLAATLTYRVVAARLDRRR